jgi:hypothetical protein
MSSSEVLRIGQLASRTGVSPDTIRLYERMGLLQKTPRTSGGYRLFPTDSIERVRLIRDASDSPFVSCPRFSKLVGRAARRAMTSVMRPLISSRRSTSRLPI